MPARDEWATASPMNAIPRRTTKVPTTEQTSAARQAARNARCMKANSKGSIIASIICCGRSFAAGALAVAGTVVSMMLVSVGMSVQVD